MIMKKFIAIIAILALFCAANAQDVTFTISDGVANASVKQKMQTALSRLLSAINNADRQNGNIDFAGIDITAEGKDALAFTWADIHFSTEEDDIVDHCIMTRNSRGAVQSYQIRNIGVDIHPVDDSYDGPARQELCVDFDTSGRITDVNFAMANSMYLSVMRDGMRLGDTDKRLQIIAWCEKLRNAYNQKDMNFMEAIYSDDALIITGKVIKERRASDVGMVNTQRVQYVKQNKRQYLDNLRRVFNRQAHNGYINVLFDDYRIVRHPSKTNYYGVTLTQKWHSRGYSDEGILFLIWDFSNEDEPKIHVRTWQPTSEEAFTLSDFKLPE